MKNKNLLIAIGVAAVIISSASVMVPTGKAGKTGSPSEGTCSDCHNNTTLNTGPGSVVVTSDAPGGKYAPSTTYHITVTVSQAGITLFGLGVEALKSDNSNAGALIITNATETHLLTASNGRVNVVQQQDGGLVTVAGSKAFMFDWTAPSADSGAVTFYACGLAAISDGDETDDDAYSTKLIVNSPTSNVGISEIASNKIFSVYPNPVKDELNISIHNLESGKVQAALYSMQGQMVADLFNENMNKGVIEKHIPVSNTWAKGTYLLQINQAGKSFIQRVIIQ